MEQASRYEGSQQVLEESEETAMNADKLCPVCLAEGKGQFVLMRVTVTGNRHEASPEGFYQVYLECPHCHKHYYDTA